MMIVLRESVLRAESTPVASSMGIIRLKPVLKSRQMKASSQPAQYFLAKANKRKIVPIFIFAG
jgi:hypothetical protein